jgi:hypothetical protein
MLDRLVSTKVKEALGLVVRVNVKGVLGRVVKIKNNFRTTPRIHLGTWVLGRWRLSNGSSIKLGPKSNNFGRVLKDRAGEVQY